MATSRLASSSSVAGAATAPACLVTAVTLAATPGLARASGGAYVVPSVATRATLSSAIFTAIQATTTPGRRPLSTSLLSSTGASIGAASSTGSSGATLAAPGAIDLFHAVLPRGEGRRDGKRSKSSGAGALLSTSKTGRERVVIVGTGWGGYAALKRLDRDLFDVTVISLRNHFLFTPLLASTTVGTLEPRSIVEPIRAVKFRDEHDFHLSAVEGVDTGRKEIACRSVLDKDHVYKVSYDKLIMAVGARANTFGLPGVRENAFFLKEVAHGQAIRRRLMENLELASQPGISEAEQDRLLHVVAVGGGPTSIEFCAELHDFLQEDCDYYFPSESKRFRITLIEGTKILGAFDERMRRAAESKIEKRSRMELVAKRVMEVRPDGVVVTTEAEGAEPEFIPSGLTVWGAGVGPQKITEALGWDLEWNRIRVDDRLRVVGKGSSVYALGDCAKIDGYPLPQTAQVAETQGNYLADMLKAESEGKRGQKPYKFKSKGLLAYIGDYEGLAEFPEIDVGDRETGFKIPSAKAGGWKAWVVWRSAYLTKLGSWRLRVQTPLDWTKTWFFGRDISRF